MVYCYCNRNKGIAGMCLVMNYEYQLLFKFNRSSIKLQNSVWLFSCSSLNQICFFLGFLSGHSGYFTHKTCDMKTCGYDLMENDVPANITKYNGVYSTFLFRDKVKEIIRNHDLSKVGSFSITENINCHNKIQIPYLYFDHRYCFNL